MQEGELSALKQEPATDLRAHHELMQPQQVQAPGNMAPPLELPGDAGIVIHTPEGLTGLQTLTRQQKRRERSKCKKCGNKLQEQTTQTTVAHLGGTCPPRDMGSSHGLPGGMTFYMLHLSNIPTVEDWFAKCRAREADRAAVSACVRDPNVEGTCRQNRRCEYIMHWRRTLFSCPHCWLLPGLCVCSHMRTFNSPTRVFVHVHHTEWGKSSNTGCVAALTLPGQAQLLLKGYKQHDDQLQQLMQDPTVTTAVLWPGGDAVLPCELKRIAAERTQGRLAVVAVDASWDGAVRMKGSYPANVIQVKLGPETVLRGQAKSLLNPVRRYRGDLENNGRVSTLEAIAHLLHELHGDEELFEGLLANLRTKVDAMLVQKLRPPVYGTVAAGFQQSARDAGIARALQYEREAAAGMVDTEKSQELAAMMRELMSGGD